MGPRGGVRYFGKICAKHPQFKGERFKVNGLCRGCGIERGIRRRKDDPKRALAYDKVQREKHATSRANKHYLKRYGITREQKFELLRKQGGKCACCRRKSDNWHVDHNHATCAVRSVLCAHCNWLIGHARENIAILKSAQIYLRKHA